MLITNIPVEYSTDVFLLSLRLKPHNESIHQNVVLNYDPFKKMIQRLVNNDIEVSKKIHKLFQLSYTIEAKLLNATNFPPLKRPLKSYVNSDTEFFGYIKDGELAGVIEIEHNNSFTDINSLVVSPSFFRQGIARKLMEFVINTFDSNLFVVETGLENKPATELYKKFDFEEVKQWNTDHGIRKIKFERRINN